MPVSGNAELKISPCPVFIAATELLDDEDRSIAIQLWHAMYAVRDNDLSLNEGVYRSKSLESQGCREGTGLDGVGAAVSKGRHADLRSCICREIEQAWQRYLRYRSKARS
jgi:hypothetical protein